MASSNYDVIVVGSGASGGWAAKRLSEAGLKVVLVEAGRQQSDANFTEHTPRFEMKYRGRLSEIIRKTRPIQKDCYACTESTYNWFANDVDEPYTRPKNKDFSWQGRLRVTGGRTNVWARQSYRLSDLDLKAASHDGYGEDWPLSYKDLAPYYDIVEDYVGITGMPEGVYELPDGKFQPPMGMTCAEKLFRSRVKEKLGWTATLGRSANITKAINGRAPCHYCGPCERGCLTHSYFNSYFTTVADALASGKCTLISDAMVYKVLMDADRNRANGILYIDRNTREAKEVRARAVVLCAQALESVRILFNSANSQYPAGLANSSGVLGHYLMDHVYGIQAEAILPSLGEPKPTLNQPVRPDGLYVVRFRNIKNGPRSKNFLRGYAVGAGGGAGFNFRARGFGQAYKQGVMDPVTRFGVYGMGECLARWENYVEIDPNLVDAFGIPVLHVHMTWGENEYAMMKDMTESQVEMLEAVGATNIETRTTPYVPGWGIHEVGIARMGSDPKRSVLNQFQQSHDVKNLFVCDAAGFSSSACQNPTMTIMTLAVRSCDYLMAEMKKGNI